MSRRSLLSTRSRGLVVAELPLHGYFLSVGGALLMLLLAADWVLPAPLPARSTQSYSALPPIRIHSQLKGPEAVIIDTSPTESVPILPKMEIAATSSQVPGSDVIDAVQRPGSSLSGTVDGSESPPATSTSAHARESLVQLGPAVADQTGPARRRGGINTQPRRKFVRAWTRKPRRSARHRRFDSPPGGCDSLNRDYGHCRYAFMTRRTN